MANRAPKQWALSKQETITSFENWRQNLEYTLSLDNEFNTYLQPGASWKRKTRDNPLRGFEDDDGSAPVHSRRTAVQKSAALDLMLGQIANFCPVISRNTITKLSTSLGDIWQSIRLHYGFQTSGAHFIDLVNVRTLMNALRTSTNACWPSLMIIFSVQNLESLTTALSLTKKKSCLQRWKISSLFAGWSCCTQTCLPW